MLRDGFFRVAAVTPKIRVADCAHNAGSILRAAEEAAEKGANAAVFPELCLTGYTCGDLFLTETLLQGAENALQKLIRDTADLPLLCAVGVPVPAGGNLYNCAAVFCGGKLLGLSAKSHIPNYGEFYEARHFSPAPCESIEVEYAGFRVPLGNDLLFLSEEMPECVIGVEICEDLWVMNTPGTRLAAGGATLLLNCSASDEVVGKAVYRRQLVATHSARLLCAYAYADAGEGESSTDLVFSGHNLIGENGSVLSESELFEPSLLLADVDLGRMLYERRHTTTWVGEPSAPLRRIPFSFGQKPIENRSREQTPLLRRISAFPFVPGEDEGLRERCERILTMQAEGLKTRLSHTGCREVVIGVSGGLDSTLALLVSSRAFKRLGLPAEGILAVSMPGFGTTGRTKSNAQRLAEEIGARFREIPIGESVNLHFRDIGHNPENRDVTYENAQARERTQVLMDLANQSGGMVVGTGDLSELALGWATYNGDHMSMYAVNASIPKTLVRHLVRYVSQNSGGALGAVLEDILDTPVSPELLPPVEGEISQRTEDIVGPYELHDFFLYYLLRFGFGPGKIFRMALQAFEDSYDRKTILKWLKIFCRRFFTQQFKRSCLPDGPKVGTVTLSPRGDWRMPSDASAALWMKELEELEKLEQAAE